MITGITASRTRLAVLENLAGAVFVISAVLLFYSVALTIDAVNGASSVPDPDMLSVAKKLRWLVDPNIRYWNEPGKGRPLRGVRAGGVVRRRGPVMLPAGPPMVTRTR
ncbi:hypothetical protein [Amycolatopsis tolypomycina]|uniref:hypothetical protein n=1 Tax=Amycolatopsis tolypomycina TaxID=208445 RepID=UPI00339FEB1C